MKHTHVPDIHVTLTKVTHICHTCKKVLKVRRNHV